jgi:Asp-tRNA(Asn)/Glu-tRNA(Gln) amidotransferase A subunit family amidase
MMAQVPKLLPSVDESEGLPVGIQLVCGIWEEEKTLALMGVIERCWNNHPNQIAPLSRPGDFIAAKQRLVNGGSDS